MTNRTFFQILVELMVLNNFFLTALLMNGMAYLIILENQIVLQPLKGMSFVLLRITRTFIFILVNNLLTP